MGYSGISGWIGLYDSRQGCAGTVAGPWLEYESRLLRKRAGPAAGAQTIVCSGITSHAKGQTLTTAELPVLADGDFYYEVLGGGRFRSTIHAQGAWNEHEQHMAPASGIMADCLDRHEPREDMRMARLSYEILGLIPGGEFEVVTTTLRPGRTIELVQAELIAEGRRRHPRDGVADDHFRHQRDRGVRGSRGFPRRRTANRMTPRASGRAATSRRWKCGLPTGTARVQGRCGCTRSTR